MQRPTPQAARLASNTEPMSPEQVAQVLINATAARALPGPWVALIHPAEI